MSNKLLNETADEEKRDVDPSQFWFVVAVDKQGWGYIIDHHPDAENMIDGTSCNDNGIEYPDEPGLYRLSHLHFRTHTDWETGFCDEWGWDLGRFEILWPKESVERLRERDEARHLCGRMRFALGRATGWGTGDSYSLVTEPLPWEEKGDG